jgi:hypothetical protein
MKLQKAHSGIFYNFSLQSNKICGKLILFLPFCHSLNANMAEMRIDIHAW